MDKKLLNSIPVQVRAETVASNKTALYLSGTVGGYWNGIALSDIRERLDDVTGDVDIHINSYGGDLFEGIAIKNYLRQLSGTVTVYIDGVAASAASVIAMGADKVLMPKDTQLMIHNPWTYAVGNAKDLRKAAEDLEKSQTSLEESYMAKFVGERSELQALLDNETWLTADEAVALGLADGLVDEVAESEPEETLEPALASILDKYRHQDDGTVRIDAKRIVITSEVVKPVDDVFKRNAEKLLNLSKSI